MSVGSKPINMMHKARTFHLTINRTDKLQSQAMQWKYNGKVDVIRHIQRNIFDTQIIIIL